MFYYAIMAARNTVQYTHIQSYTQIHPLKKQKDFLKTVKNGKKEQNRQNTCNIRPTLLCWRMCPIQPALLFAG